MGSLYIMMEKTCNSQGIKFSEVKMKTSSELILLVMFQPDVFGCIQAWTKIFYKNLTYIINSITIVSY